MLCFSWSTSPISSIDTSFMLPAQDEESEEEEDQEAAEAMQQIQDETQTNLVNLRRTIYLTIMSSLDFEEAGHKLLKIKMAQGQEQEIPIMILECASQERTYIRYYGLLGARFCMLRKEYQVRGPGMIG